MREKEPLEEDVIDRAWALARSKTKETVSLGITGIGVSILGDKIGNNFLHESGSATANTVFLLMSVSWANLWLRQNLNDSIDFLSKQIENNRERIKSLKQKLVQ